MSAAGTNTSISSRSSIRTFFFIEAGRRGYLETDDRTWGAELGGAWRQTAVFDNQDYLDIGLKLNAGRSQTQSFNQYSIL